MLRGVIAPGITFFDSKGRIDKERCKWHMEWMLSKGVKGLFVTGTYGSGYLLSVQEKETIYEIAKQVSDHYLDAFVIAHAAGINTEESALLSRLAGEIGLDAVSSIHPLHYDFTDKENLLYYEALLHDTDKPVYAYNNPALTGKALSGKFMREAKAIGISGVKDSAINVQLAAAVFADELLSSEKFQYIPGTSTGWPVFRKMGANAMIAGMCNYVPELVVALYNASYEDEMKTAKIYKIMNDLSGRLKFGNSIKVSHICLKARGYDAGYGRLPMRIQYGELKAEIAEADALIEKAIEQLKSIE